MQINGSFQIVTGVTSVVPTFLSCIALFDLLVLLGFTVTFALFVRMRWGFRLCGGDHGLCPLDSHKPLKRLDRNFYMGALLLLLGSSGFVLCCDCGGNVSYSLRQTSNRRPNKNKNPNYTLFQPLCAFLLTPPQILCIL